MVLYESLLSRLETQHEAISVLISPVMEKWLIEPQPGKWSIHDNIAHLARYQPVFTERIKSILKTPGQNFERYSAETDPEFEEWRKRSSAQLLSTLGEDRWYIYDLISSLSEKELELVGIHPKFGEMTIVQWTEFFLLHEAHHMFTIFQLTKTIK